MQGGDEQIDCNDKGHGSTNGPLWVLVGDGGWARQGYEILGVEMVCFLEYPCGEYDFPNQDAVIQFVIEAIQAESFNPKTLFLIGSYTIGPVQSNSFILSYWLDIRQGEEKVHGKNVAIGYYHMIWKENHRAYVSNCLPSANILNSEPGDTDSWSKLWIELLVQEHRNLRNIGHPFKPFHKL
ncbi:hypothetical protein AKJ16_DCAP24165 [Drosera capensis]